MPVYSTRSIDLLHESTHQAQLEVNNARKQMNSACEIAPPIAVAFRQDPEALEPPNTVLDFDPQPCQRSICLLMCVT